MFSNNLIPIRLLCIFNKFVVWWNVLHLSRLCHVTVTKQWICSIQFILALIGLIASLSHFCSSCLSFNCSNLFFRHLNDLSYITSIINLALSFILIVIIIVRILTNICSLRRLGQLSVAVFKVVVKLLLRMIQVIRIHLRIIVLVSSHSCNETSRWLFSCPIFCESLLIVITLLIKWVRLHIYWYIYKTQIKNNFNLFFTNFKDKNL